MDGSGHEAGSSAHPSFGHDRNACHVPVRGPRLLGRDGRPAGDYMVELLRELGYRVSV